MAFKNFARPTTPFSAISVGTPCHYKCNKALCNLMDVALVLVEKRSPKQFEASRSKNAGSVVCKLFTFQASSPKPLGQLEPNLVEMFLG
jgi:hypothetical protein